MAKYDKRRNAFWDVIYTNNSVSLTPHNWDFRNNKGPAKLLFEAQTLLELIQAQAIKNYTCRDISFSVCDFEGRFEGEEITFRKCKFTKCDFGGSFWKGAKFSECEFLSCSLTMVEFELCQFYACQWKDISISGTETKLSNTLISNPGDFISAAFVCQDSAILTPKNKTSDYQFMRHENTKAKIARSIWKNCESYGDEGAYYSALKTAVNQSLKARIFEAKYNLLKRKSITSNFTIMLGCLLEYGILNISGFINKWGQSIVRPAFIGVLITLFFGTCYAIFPGIDVPESVQRDTQSMVLYGVVQGFDITFLIGYTKYANFKLPLGEQAIYALNAFFGLWWYAILVPTVINKLSRVNA